MEEVGNEEGGKEDGGMEDGGMEEGGMEDGGMEEGGMEDGGKEDGGKDDGGMEEGNKGDGFQLLTSHISRFTFHLCLLSLFTSHRSPNKKNPRKTGDCIFCCKKSKLISQLS